MKQILKILLICCITLITHSSYAQSKMLGSSRSEIRSVMKSNHYQKISQSKRILEYKMPDVQVRILFEFKSYRCNKVALIMPYNYGMEFIKTHPNYTIYYLNNGVVRLDYHTTLTI